jgi:PAT family beta-lactamase induction signal transducer AmpG
LPDSPPARAAAGAPTATPLRTKLAWVSTFYFASGFPYGLLIYLFPVYLRAEGVSLGDIGRVAALTALPYTFKPLWAPLVDWVGSRKQWVLGCQVGIALVAISLMGGDGSALSPALWTALVALALLSATQDIAVDAYTIELLDERERGPANGIRVAAYRVALILAGGALVAASDALGWRRTFGAAGGVMLAVSVVTLLVPGTRRAPAASVAAIDRPRSDGVLAGVRRLTLRVSLAVWTPVGQLLRLPSAWAVALFVLTFKLGDLALQPMIQPFWVDRGYSGTQIGVVLGTVGVGATVAGALLGGVLTARLGTFRALWLLGATQALSNLGYYVAAVTGAPAPVLYTAAVIEQFTQGLGTAAFLTFLMALCDRRFAATQFALLSALFRLGGVVVSAYSGTAAQALGYAPYFLLTFALAVPAFALLPFLRRLELADGVKVPE